MHLCCVQLIDVTPVMLTGRHWALPNTMTLRYNLRIKLLVMKLARPVQLEPHIGGILALHATGHALCATSHVPYLQHGRSNNIPVKQQ